MMPEIKYSLSRVWYPLVMVSAVVIHLALKAAGVPFALATYIPVLLAAVTVTFLEIYFPYRNNWAPVRSDVLNDSAFMVMVQVLLPQMLGYLVAVLLIEASDTDLSIWPSHLPNIVQVILMIVLADFLRYWLHRASHNFMPLWQLHAVHHSPDKLYWLNVGRFHPLEKTIQFLFDALPFILLGIDESVLSLYFVFYAVNGYFQHSNIDLKFGWLNYLVSSAELHRWHHSDEVAESNRNYGNNIIVWDILFGTYYLPADQSVGVLGLKNKQYPTSFLSQMKTPFIPRLDKRYLPMISYLDIFTNILLKLRLLGMYFGQWAFLMRATREPKSAQANVLKKILEKNKGSGFGVEHNFAGITDPMEYRERCSIQSYDSLKPYMDDSGGHGLTNESPCFYQVTSGTSGEAKYLPMTAIGLKNDKRLQNMVALARYLDNPSTYTGKMFAVVSPAIEGYMDSDVPFGSASGMTYLNMPSLARSKYVVPYPVFTIGDYEKKYLLIALFALAEPKVSIAATANPSTLVRLLEVINDNYDHLHRMLSTGLIDVSGLDATVAAELSAALKPNTERAEYLKNRIGRNGRLTYKEVWPNLQQLVTWTGGSCGIALSSLLNDLPGGVDLVEMGYLASEVRGTLTIGHNIGVPTLTNTFYEFVERDEWEADVKNTVLLDQLEKDKQYYVLITTVNGLYRYFMNDIVQVTGFYNKCPTLKFLQKGKGATNITGEKLYESQVLDAIQALEKTAHITVRFQQWIADEIGSCYRVFIESDDSHLSKVDAYAAALEKALSSFNIEYKEKRASGRLKPLQVNLLEKGTGEALKSFNVAKGQREGQYKALSLTYSKDCNFPFDDHLRKGAE